MNAPLLASRWADGPPAKGDGRTFRQVGWIGQTGAVYAMDDETGVRTEPGGFSPLLVEVTEDAPARAAGVVHRGLSRVGDRALRRWARWVLSRNVRVPGPSQAWRDRNPDVEV